MWCRGTPSIPSRRRIAAMSPGGPHTKHSRCAISGTPRRSAGTLEQVGTVVTDFGTGDHMNRHVGGAPKLTELLFEDDVFRALDAIQQHDVGAALDRLEECSQRGDPDAARDQQHPTARAPLGGERTEWSFREHARATLDPLQSVRVIAQVFHGDTQVFASRRGRERERMRLPPPARSDEPPQEELAGLRVERVEVASADVYRRNARRFALHSFDTQAMAPIVMHRYEDSPPQQHPEHEGVQAHPPHACRAVAVEVSPDGELMCERERDCEVCVQMHEVPRLPVELAPRHAYRGHRDRDKQREPDPGHQHIGVVRDKVARLIPRVTRCRPARTR